jgi:MFS family permease
VDHLFHSLRVHDKLHCLACHACSNQYWRGLHVSQCSCTSSINFPPGKMRNITVGLFGAMAPIGAAGGGVFAGCFVQLTPWKWLFFFLFVHRRTLNLRCWLTILQSNFGCSSFYFFCIHRAWRTRALR